MVWDSWKSLIWTIGMLHQKRFHPLLSAQILLQFLRVSIIPIYILKLGTSNALFKIAVPSQWGKIIFGRHFFVHFLFNEIFFHFWYQISKVVIILKAMAFLNLSTKNQNHGRENYLAMIKSRSVNKFLFSVSYEAYSKPNMIKYYRFLSYYW